jgi:hypothetical protein
MSFIEGIVTDLTRVKRLTKQRVDQNGGLACNLWPPDLRFANELGAIFEDTTRHSSDTVPGTLPSVEDWAYVAINTKWKDSTRRHVLLYRSVPPAMLGNLCAVTLRIQGFVSWCNLRALGNWDGLSK